MGAENLTPTRIQSPDHPAHRESLYRLSYHGLQLEINCVKMEAVCSVLDILPEKHCKFVSLMTHPHIIFISIIHWQSPVSCPVRVMAEQAVIVIIIIIIIIITVHDV
jgi:hypothetical protein